MEVNLIKDIAKRYEERINTKRKFDNAISLSLEKGKENFIKLSVKSKNRTVRLLDEGMVVDANSRPWFYIKKGVLKTFYDNLQDDYVGSINLGHMDFASFPFLIGQWTKKDLTLVDIGDGRLGLDVKLNLDEESVFVKELHRNDYPIGVSAEFPYSIDWESTELLGYEVLNAIDIRDFAIVGEAGNASSGGIFLKGEPEMAKSIFERMLSKHLNTEKKEETKPTEPLVEEEKKDDEGATEETKEEGMTDEQMMSIVEQAADALENQEKMEELMEKMDKELDDTKAELEAAKTELEEMKKSLSAKEEGTDKALSKFAALSAKYGLSQKERTEKLLADQEEQKKEDKKMSAYESEDGLGRYE